MLYITNDELLVTADFRFPMEEVADAASDELDRAKAGIMRRVEVGTLPRNASSQVAEKSPDGTPKAWVFGPTAPVVNAPTGRAATAISGNDAKHTNPVCMCSFVGKPTHPKGRSNNGVSIVASCRKHRH